MKFKKFLVCGVLGAAVMFIAQSSFAAYCYWTLSDGTTVVQNIQGSIKSGLSEQYINQLHACCESDPGFCGKYATDEEGYYNVQLAAKYNRTQTLKYFLKYRDCGATVDRFRAHPTEPGEFNALMYAINNTNTDMVEWLLFYKANPTVKNYMGKDAKYYVEKIDKAKNPTIVKMVMDAWNKAMGYSQNLILQKKTELKKSLNGQNVKDMLNKIQNKYSTQPLVS